MFFALFIYRPVATILISLTPCAAFSASGCCPVAPLPQVDFPVIMVSASAAGSPPETIWPSSVATPLERSLGRIAGVNEMTSLQLAGQYAHHSRV